MQSHSNMKPRYDDDDLPHVRIERNHDIVIIGNVQEGEVVHSEGVLEMKLEL